MEEPWFVVKRYGFGMSPSGWRGWLFTFAFVLVFVVVGWLTRTGGRAAAVLTLPALTLGFMVIVRLKGDGKPWRWRWGDDD